MDEAPPPEPQPRQHARARRDVSALDAAGERSKAQPNDRWEQEQATDQADEARLKRKLMICRDCQTTGPARDDAAGGSR
jgi:hypothetical protein